MSAENENICSMNLFSYMFQEGEGVKIYKDEEGILYKKIEDKGNFDV